MFAFGVAIILVQFLQIFHAQDPITTLNSSITSEAEAVDIFAKVEPDQVLPLVLFQEHVSVHLILPELNLLQIPKDIEQAQNSEDECLAPQEFDDLNQLECNLEPLPLIYPDTGFEGPCGGTGDPHYIAYKICPEEHAYTYVTSEIPLYEFCYDMEKKNTIYTNYYIPSPNLLKSFLLFRERSVKYPILIDDGFKPSILGETNETEIRELNSWAHPEKQSYKLQMLVPEANMALALWRKTTYRNFNLEWQHEDLISLWNQINRKVSSYASQLFVTNTKISVRTGVIDIDPKSKNKTQMFNIWVNMITTMPPKDTMVPTGVVILMNNFIRNTKETDDSSTAIPKAIEEALESYCVKNLCVETLKKNFKDVGGQIRCCSFSSDNVKVRELFDIERRFNTDDKIFTLRIPGVTTTFSKQTMRF